MISIRSEEHSGSVITDITNTQGQVIYLEVLALDKSARFLTKAIKEFETNRDKSYFVRDEEMKRVIAPDNKGEIFIEKFDKNMALGVYAHESIVGREFNVLFGTDIEDCYLSFKKWMQDINILPYPKGFNNKLNMEVERFIFDYLIKENNIKVLPTHNCVAYEIPKKYQNGDPAIQNVIIAAVQKSGILKIDQLRERLTKEAPLIGESNPELAEVFASFTRSDKTVYFLIEYDPKQDSFFAFVKHENGLEEWGEHKLSKIFYDESIYFNELYNEFLDMDGQVIQKGK